MTLLFSLIVLILVAYLVFALLLPLIPAPFNQIVTVIFVIALILYLFKLLFGFGF